jgi:hypothetical protein
MILKYFFRMESLNWIDLDQDREEWRAFVKVR